MQPATASHPATPAPTASPGPTPAPYLAAVKRKVTLGFINTTHVEVVAGVTLGERVVVTGVGSLKDGGTATVTVADGDINLDFGR